jgi:hypothetical protein
MLSRQEEERERREVLENDRRVREEQKKREQTGTYLSHTHDDIHQGRFGAIGAAVVVGAKADVASVYPAASAHQRDPVSAERPLGFRVDEMPPLEPSAVSSVEATGGAEALSSSASSDVEHAAPPFSSTQGSDDGAA